MTLSFEDYRDLSDADRMYIAASIALAATSGREILTYEVLGKQAQLSRSDTNFLSSTNSKTLTSNAKRSRTPLPEPKATLEVNNLTIIPPGGKQATLRMVNFRLEPGQAVGVIGPSGSGKTALARAVANIWKPAGGEIRLGGATLDQYDPAALAEYIGYLPDRIELFTGTVAQNIARMSQTIDAEKVVAAAKSVGAHEMILRLPNSYDTHVGSGEVPLSSGQIQQIGLARAFYNDPIVLVLDEPTSSLDNEGSQALMAAINAFKSERKSVVVTAKRPVAIQECDLLLVLEGGMSRAFGPKDEVIRQTIQNADALKSRGAAN